MPKIPMKMPTTPANRMQTPNRTAAAVAKRPMPTQAKAPVAAARGMANRSKTPMKFGGR